MIRKKYSTSGLLGLITLFLFVTPVFAHVIVTPKQVGIAKEQVFTVSVPTEKDTPTVALKLLIPKGVTDVMPNAKPDWTIHTVKNGDSVTEIDWTEGSIPSGQRDEFYFQAQVPPTPTTLQWKAYQTYQDGTVIAWDHTPTANPEDDSAPPPYSTTQVINDLTNTQTTGIKKENSSQLPLTFSIISLALSASALVIALQKSH